MDDIASAGQVSGGTTAAAPGLLGACSLPALQRRTSFKWRTYPADVLPAFVAEMDYDLAEPIKEAVTAAMNAGDAGYAHISRLGEVAPAQRWRL